MALQSRGTSLAVAIALSVAAVAAVTGAIYGLREVMPVEGSGVIYLLPVLLASTRWGLWLGVGTAIASAAAFNYFHIPPTGRFSIAEEENWVALGAFLVVAVVSSGLADSARSRAEDAERRRREADLTAEMARVLLGGSDLDDSMRVVGQRIARAFDLPSVELTSGWRDSDERGRALPIIVGGDRAGTVVVPRATPAEVIEAIEQRVIPSLETLLAAARERENLEAQVIETRALRRSNVVKTALLRSVSHDLRSPLTAITAAAGGLGSPTLDSAARAELISVIDTETERLTRLVDNLLDLSRIQSGEIEARADVITAEELIGAALDSVDAPASAFDVAIDPELPAIAADGGQVERALANVIENSLRYAGDAPVTIRSHLIGRQVAIQISDQGPGVPTSEIDRVFEPFYRGERDGASGSGLGLAIARGFAQANHGTLRLRSAPQQGATFTFQLPVAPNPAAAAGQ
jgi:two-component system sensor histidine kinase KdpD